MDVDSALGQLLAAMKKEHELQLRALLHVAVMRFESACQKTKEISDAAKAAQATAGREREKRLASLSALVQQVVDEADAEPAKGDKKAAKATSASSDHVVAASKALIDALRSGPDTRAAPAPTLATGLGAAAPPSAAPPVSDKASLELSAQAQQQGTKSREHRDLSLHIRLYAIQSSWRTSSSCNRLQRAALERCTLLACCERALSMQASPHVSFASDYTAPHSSTKTVKLMDKAALRNKNMLGRVLKERRIMAKASELPLSINVVKLHFAFRTR